MPALLGLVPLIALLFEATWGHGLDLKGHSNAKNDLKINKKLKKPESKG